MNIKLYIVGNKIEKFYLEGIKEYEKRLSRYCKIKLQRFKNEEALLKKITEKHHKILVSTGKESLISSEGLSKNIDSLGISGKSDAVIIMGTESITADEIMNISPMEMDIGLKTMIMYEQIYRAYRILHNQPYHK
ncbi:23S rRNA (pseudouridine(1915)-N(3))-methyltransferase RlmH [Evansella sp. AB-P1]|uniref:23S rRNA (pseudouridine(1915)-N(3))-methyltransferase RlmH n=1 Tax=Evansella sp. AB-P1 TaxID=3037653 RepID=UPI00241BF7E6|nr:23S rRNA (pseudouridine(1915)-N(3))-methyltransferase RlmH [Evansella sp. AB-P1]MDG5789437.1 23S rRNA (pseudouridine(1915)-N(3))-methyltransferase RlmH [Evansella sp. AB-P1]